MPERSASHTAEEMTWSVKVKPVVEQFSKDLDPALVKAMYESIDKVRAGQ